MGNSKFFIFILCLSLSQLIAVPINKPLLGGQFCSGKLISFLFPLLKFVKRFLCVTSKGFDLLDYKQTQDYVYDYQTDTMLWINDVSEESKSNMVLKTTVIVRRLAECKFLLRLENSQLTGDSISDDLFARQHLNDYVVLFEFNSEGEIDTDIKFDMNDSKWSRNIKRGIISAFQTKSETNLRKMDLLNDSNEMSTVGYETDVQGRCRTTYELDADNFVSGKSIRLNKKKSLHACTSNYVYQSIAHLGKYRSQQVVFSK